MKDILLLLSLKLRVLKNHSLHNPAKERFKMLIVTMLGLIFIVMLQYGFYKVLGYLKELKIIEDILITNIFNMIFFGFSLIMVFGGTVTTISIVFFSKDYDFILYHPINIKAILFIRILEALFFASWIVFFFSTPLVIALGRFLNAGFLQIMLSFISIIPFTFIFIVLGVLLTLIVMRIIPSKYVKEAIFGFSIVLSITLLIILFNFNPQKFTGALDFKDPANIIQRTNAISIPYYFPGNIAVRSIFSIMKHNYLSYFYNLCILIISTIVLSIITVQAGYFLFKDKLYSVREAKNIIKKRTYKDIEFHFLNFLSTRPAEILKKDMKIFIRDSSQWSQLLIIFSLVAVHFFNIKTQMSSDIFVKNLVSILNPAILLFIVITITGRFGYPLIAMEGRAFWIIKTAPIKPKEYILSKILFLFIPIYILCVFILIISDILLTTPLFFMLFSIIMLFFPIILIVILSLYFGSLYPDFEETDPTKIAINSGGLIFLISSIILTGINTFFYSGFLLKLNIEMNLKTFRMPLISAFILNLTFNSILCIFLYKKTLKNIKQIEF